MSRNNATKSTTSTVLVRTGKKSPSTSKKVTTVVTKSSRRRRRGARNNGSNSSIHPLALRYLATLNDPFDHGAISLGFGCFQPSALGTMFYRASILTASDGTFTVAQQPFLNTTITTSKPIGINVSGGPNLTWSTVNYANVNAFQSTVQDARIVSMGMKVIPLVSPINNPGSLYAGTIPSLDTQQITDATLGLSASLLQTSPYLKVGYGNCAAIALSRPEDSTSFEFLASVAGAPSSTTSQVMSTNFIVGVGYPASTTIVVECVVNFEYFNSYTSSAVMGHPLEGNDGDTLARAYPNAEALWSLIKPRLTDPGTVSPFEDVGHSTAAALRASRHTMLGSLSASSTTSETTTETTSDVTFRRRGDGMAASRYTMMRGYWG